MENIKISYPGYFVILIAVIAVLYALSLYTRDKRITENKSWLPYVLGFFRFFSVLGILWLLLAPLFKHFISEEQKPLVLITQDRSGSIQATTDAAIIEKVQNGLGQLGATPDSPYEIQSIYFGENITTGSTDSINSESTNISKPLEYIADSYKGQNLAAIILATDGIYNEGKNPLYVDLQSTVPIYTVPMGDTTIRTDLLIKNVLHNRVAYLNDKFIIETDVQAYNSKGARSQLTLYKYTGSKKTKIDSKSIVIDSDNFFKSYQFELSADQVGNVKYVVEAARINNEVSSANNSRNIYLEVLDARQKILLVSHATHPDIKAIKQIVTNNKNYEIEIKHGKNAPSTIGKYDIVIMHNLPSVKYPVSGLLNEIEKSKKPVFYVIGAETNITSLNSHQDIVKIKGSNKSLNSITPLVKRDFNLFTMSDNLINHLQQYVPLKVPFGEYTTQPTAKVLLNQKIGTVDTDYPLLAYSDVNNHKQAILTGEGIWRWRLYEYQEYTDHKITEELISKTLQFISKKEDKRQYRAYVSKNSFKENENILFDAQLYNENYEAINTPGANLVISNSSGEKFDYSLSKQNNIYFLDAGRFKEGNYTFTSATQYNGKKLTAYGKFNVQSIIKEQYDITAKHDMLFNLSEESGGKVIYPHDLNQLEEILASSKNMKSIIYQSAQTTPMLNFRWFLGLLILFLALEWILRRYFGNY